MIGKEDHAVAAWGEHAAGPGWANSLLWVIVRSRDGRLRQECLQPEEQTAEMHTLFSVSATVNAQMTQAVKNWVVRKR